MRETVWIVCFGMFSFLLISQHHVESSYQRELEYSTTPILFSVFIIRVQDNAAVSLVIHRSIQPDHYKTRSQPLVRFQTITGLGACMKAGSHIAAPLPLSVHDNDCQCSRVELLENCHCWPSFCWSSCKNVFKTWLALNHASVYLRGRTWPKNTWFVWSHIDKKEMKLPIGFFGMNDSFSVVTTVDSIRYFLN